MAKVERLRRGGSYRPLRITFESYEEEGALRTLLDTTAALDAAGMTGALRHSLATIGRDMERAMHGTTQEEVEMYTAHERARARSQLRRVVAIAIQNEQGEVTVRADQLLDLLEDSVALEARLRTLAEHPYTKSLIDLVDDDVRRALDLDQRRPEGA